MGFDRTCIERIAGIARTWPGGWSVDLAGDVVSPDVVLIAEAGDRFAPALHLEQTGCSVVVTAVLGDEPVPLGTFPCLEEALRRLTEIVSAQGALHAGIRVN